MSNRIIKYKLFDKTEDLIENLMYDSVGITPEGIPYINLTRDDGTDYQIFWENEDDYELLQFTGLLDKNGVEIYEGDIVVKQGYMWFDNGKPNYRGVVEWVYSQWQVIAHCVHPGKRGISDGINFGLNDDGIEENDKSEWEVIGNKPENPELLEVSNV